MKSLFLSLLAVTTVATSVEAQLFHDPSANTYSCIFNDLVQRIGDNGVFCRDYTPSSIDDLPIQDDIALYRFNSDGTLSHAIAISVYSYGMKMVTIGRYPSYPERPETIQFWLKGRSFDEWISSADYRMLDSMTEDLTLTLNLLEEHPVRQRSF